MFNWAVIFFGIASNRESKLICIYNRRVCARSHCWPNSGLRSFKGHYRDSLLSDERRSSINFYNIKAFNTSRLISPANLNITIRVEPWGIFRRIKLHFFYLGVRKVDIEEICCVQYTHPASPAL